MAKQSSDDDTNTAADRFNINPSRFTEQRAPTFLGGDIDPITGNLIQGTVTQASQGSTPTQITPPRLSTVTLPTPDPEPEPEPEPEAEEPEPFAPYPGSSRPHSMGKGGGRLDGRLALGVEPSADPESLGYMKGSLRYEQSLYDYNKPRFEAQPYAQKQEAINAYYKTTPSAGGAGMGLSLATGGLLCHAAGTMIRLANGHFKAVEEIKVGDEVFLGGSVIGRGEALSDELYLYRGTRVTGYHAVFENGTWLRVCDSALAEAVNGRETVYPILTENQLLVTEHYICADFLEVPDTPETEDMRPSEKLEMINENVRRNRWLRGMERHFGFTGNTTQFAAAD